MRFKKRYINQHSHIIIKIGTSEENSLYVIWRLHPFKEKNEVTKQGLKNIGETFKKIALKLKKNLGRKFITLFRKCEICSFLFLSVKCKCHPYNYYLTWYQMNSYIVKFLFQKEVGLKFGWLDHLALTSNKIKTKTIFKITWFPLIIATSPFGRWHVTEIKHMLFASRPYTYHVKTRKWLYNTNSMKPLKYFTGIW